MKTLILVCLSLAMNCVAQAKVEFSKTLSVEELEIGTKLEWITSLEVNMESFVVQFSESGTLFDNITAISAVGNSTTTRPYQFMDFSMRNNAVFYRLKMIDREGTISFTEPVKFQRLKVNNLSVVKMSATATAHNFELTVDALKKMDCEIKLTNLDKKVVFFDKKMLTSGLNNLVIDLKDFPETFYTLSITADAVETEKMMLQKIKSSAPTLAPVASAKKISGN